MMLARNFDWNGKTADYEPFLAHFPEISEIVGLSAPNLLLVPSSPMRSEASLRKFWRSIRQIEQSPEAARMLREAAAFRLAVKNQWAMNREQIAFELGRMLCMPIPREAVSVFTTHPEVPVGHAIPQLHAICWGHKEEFKNYHSVYLTHELLHFVLPFDRREIDHALIELIADDELRIRLNGSGRYFQYPGHARLRPLKKKLLPHWKRYLRRRSGTILALLRECQRAV